MDERQMKSYAGLRSERLEQLEHHSRKQVGCKSLGSAAGLTTGQLALKAENTPKGAVVGGGKSNIACHKTLAPATMAAEQRQKTRGGRHRLYGVNPEECFSTTWRLGPDGRRMGLYIARSGGYAHLDTSPTDIDLEKTYKKEKTRSPLFHLSDHIVNERFVTSNELANCSDVLKPLGYRGAPTGPAPIHFPNPFPNAKPGQANNLDHRLWPYRDSAVHSGPMGCKGRVACTTQQKSSIAPTAWFLAPSQDTPEKKAWRTKRKISAPWSSASVSEMLRKSTIG